MEEKFLVAGILDSDTNTYFLHGPKGIWGAPQDQFSG